MKARKIGPGVYAIRPLGEIEMDAWVIAERREAGLPTPDAPRHLTDLQNAAEADDEDWTIEANRNYRMDIGNGVQR